jgi:hypothetical protein
MKKSRKGRFEWKKTCLDVRFSHQKLKTLMKTNFTNKVILLQETVKYWSAINLCYGRQETLELQGCILDAHTWAVCNAITKTIILVVKQCIRNQIQGPWLLFNALNVAFSFNVVMQSEIEQCDIDSNNFVKGDFDFELQTLSMHMMGEVMVVLAPFLAFATTYITTKAHNMLVLMLDPRFQISRCGEGFCRKGKSHIDSG